MGRAISTESMITAIPVPCGRITYVVAVNFDLKPATLKRQMSELQVYRTRAFAVKSSFTAHAECLVLR